jgi:FixJ family two-component response regulator
LSRPPLVCIVDDDDSLRQGMDAFFRSAGCETSAFPDAEALLAAVGIANADCLISDLNLPGMSGIDLKLELCRRKWEAIAVLMTGYATPGVFKQAQEAGFSRVIEKPFDMETLLTQLDGLWHPLKRNAS